MIESIINSLLYILTLFVYVYLKRRIDVYFILLFTYTLVAICGSCLIGSNMITYNLSLGYFLYLFICVILCISPYKYADFNKFNVDVNFNIYIKILLYVFVFAGIVSLYYGITKALALFALGEWGGIRNQVYGESVDIELYENTIDRLCKNIFNYLSPFGIVIAMYQFTRKRFHLCLTLIIFLIWILNGFASAAVVASRGMIFVLIIKIIVVYIIFRKLIPRRRNKYILTIALSAGIFLGSYLIAVTESRFGANSGDSIFYYLGHSMLTFNEDIAQPIQDYGYGKYFFKWIYEIFGANSDLVLSKLGCTHGSAFMTFIGCFYVDFGFFGTLIICGITYIILSHFTTKSYYRLSDIIIIAYFAIWLLNGVFVVGRSESLQWLMAFVVYGLVRFLESRHTKFGRIDQL